MKPTFVDSSQCHLWTDALHTRQLAREALNRWDRGTYVRMSVTAVWTALETSCQEALNAPGLGRRFKEDLDAAIGKAGAPPIDWSQGIWQKVRLLQERRKLYVHGFLSLNDLFPEASVADESIETVRRAVSELHARLAKPEPAWLALNHSRGWQAESSFGTPNVIALHAGLTAEDPNTLKVYLVIGGEEKLSRVLPAGADAQSSIDQLLDNSNLPISGVRVYNCGELVQDLIVSMRGNV
jgi:hypothetical protein